jgi:hypothetical protein
VLRVGAYVPRNASGGKTQEEKNTLQATAGKLRIVARAEWRLGEEAGDPWEGAKAGRWLGEGGSAIVRAGLRAWKESGVEEAEGRRVGIIGVGRDGEWPGWLEGVPAREVVEKWRDKSPLWLLEVLPNLPVAQLAVEIGARGPVETLRERDGVEGDVERRIQRWGRRGVEWVVSVRSTSVGAKAEVWGWEGEK